MGAAVSAVGAVGAAVSAVGSAVGTGLKVTGKAIGNGIHTVISGWLASLIFFPACLIVTGEVTVEMNDVITALTAIFAGLPKIGLLHRLTPIGEHYMHGAIMGGLIMTGPWANTPTSEVRLAWYNVRPKYNVEVEAFTENDWNCTGKGEVQKIKWGGCLTVDGNVTSYRLQGHKKKVPALPKLPTNCAMHYFSDPDCLGDFIGFDLHVNHRDDFHTCRKAPWTFIDASTPTFRSMRLDCCQAPFCEVPNPVANKIEKACQDPVKFQQLKNSGHIPQAFPPPPPFKGMLSNENGSYMASGWTEALQRSWFNRGTPNETWTSSFDPVWWESEVFQNWAPT